MATDSSELTFIRCPSCRSLVPAISTRCRMCGATLNTAGSASKESPNADGRPSSRIRQRTVSMQNASDQFVSPSDTKAEDTFGLREADTQEATPEHSLSNKISEEKIVSDMIPNIDPSDPLGAFIEEVPVEVASEPSTVMEEEADLPERYVPNKSEAVAVKNGVHAHQPEISAVVEKVEVSKPVAVKETQSVTSQAFVVPETVTTLKPREQVVLDAVTSKQPVIDTHSKPVATRVTTEKEQSLGSGKLVGWLVSYENPQGKAIELRDGKFFVSKTSLKLNDLLLQDASISTPHALIKAVAGEGLLLQDLMSERGVFVRKKTTDGYQKSLETIKLEHGDWIRFGDVEFLVCLVAHKT